MCLSPVDMSVLSVMLQERSGNNSFTHEALSLKYKLDNEFELIFVVSLNCKINKQTWKSVSSTHVQE